MPRMSPEDRRRARDDARREDIRRRVYGWIGAKRRSAGDLAALIGMPQSTFYIKLKDPERFTLGEWWRLNEIISDGKEGW